MKIYKSEGAGMNDLCRKRAVRAANFKRSSLAVLVVLLAALSSVSSVCRSQDILQDNAFKSKEYLVVISGTAGNERFSGAKGLLTVAYAEPISLNAYQFTLVGFPHSNSRNCFYWNSEESYMTVNNQELVCDIKRPYMAKSDNHFFYLSPVLLKNSGMLTHREKERRKLAEEMALPTKVFAQAGRLTARFSTRTVRGTVWMKGYDLVENSYVLYRAEFYGNTTSPLEQNIELEKNLKR